MDSVLELIQISPSAFAVVLGMLLIGYFIHLRRRLELFGQLRAVEVFKGVNDDADAVTTFVKLLGHANTRIEVFDDGNNMDESPYNSPEVMDTLREKLASCPEFKAVFFFNVEEPLRLRDDFDDDERVNIYTVPVGSSRAPGETHYKIVDGGKMAYLSTHLFNNRERKFEIIDCRKVHERLFHRVAGVQFGRLRQHVLEQFPEHHEVRTA